MPKQSLCILLSWIFGSVHVIAAEPDRALIADLVRPHLFSRPAINFDGTQVAAFSATADGRTSLLLYDTATRKAQTVRPGGTRDIFRFAWLDNTNLIFNLSQENRYAYGLYIANTRQVGQYVNLNRGDSALFVGASRDNPLEPIVWIRQSSAAEGLEDGLLQYNGRLSYNSDVVFADEYYGPRNTRANILRRLPTPPDLAVGYTADRFGTPSFAITIKHGRVSLWQWQTDRWAKCPVDLEETEIAGAGGFGTELLLRGPRTGSNPRSVHHFHQTNRSLGPPLVKDAKHDVSIDQIHQRDSTGEIIGLNYTTIGPRTVWFDQDLATLQATLESTMPGMLVRCLGFDRAETKFLFHAFSDRHPGKFYLFYRGRNDLSLIADGARWIKPDHMRPTQLLQFRTEDGLELDGLLTLPTRGNGGRPPPAVVIPSEDPNGTQIWGWNETAQLLANRGYAVFQPNHRGASIYAWITPKAAEWDFRQLHRDVSDGVKELIRGGLIDPANVAILGTNFGAFLALCGAAYEPDLYRAAIGISGVYDWADVLAELKINRSSLWQAALLRRFLGDPAKAESTYSEISPLRHISKVKAAFLVAQGQNEVGPTSTGQSRRLVAALKAERRTVEVVTAAGIDPGFNSAENRLKLAKAIDAFLVRHVPVR